MTLMTFYDPPKRKQRDAPLQDSILEYIRDYKVGNDGNSPTYQQIASALGKSQRCVYDKVQRLVVRGILKVDRSGRILLGGMYIPPEE
jgi:Mn-dependent DtxR family transcriptional regulator